MTGTLLWLFAASCFTLCGLSVSALLVARAQKQKEKRSARLTLVGQPAAPIRQIPLSVFTPSAQAEQSFGARCVALVGINRDRLAQYPVPWWVVVAISLLLAKGAQVAGALVVGGLAYLALPFVWVMVCRSIFGWMEKQRKAKAVVQLPDMLDQIVRAVRVGLPVLEAIRVAAVEAPEPTKTEFTKLIDQVSVGTPLPDAVAAMAQRCALPEYSFFATTLSLQNQTGGALSETLLSLAEVVRKRIAIVEKGKALSSEAKATAAMLTALPFATGVLLSLANPEYMMVLITEPVGHKLLGIAAISLVLGLITIRTMFQRALSLT